MSKEYLAKVKELLEACDSEQIAHKDMDRLSTKEGHMTGFNLAKRMGLKLEAFPKLKKLCDKHECLYQIRCAVKESH